jgi:nucleoside-diphosphate-sugar epimerase
MNVVLIGGTGNISEDCAAALLKEGHNVFSLTRGNSKCLPGITPIIADRTNPQELTAALKNIKPEVVVDFLGFTPEDIKIDIEVLSGRTDQLIFISSATVYSKPHKDLPITEDHPLGNHFSEYAQLKQECESLLAKQDAVPVTIVRPSHTYSKRWVPNAVSSAGYTFVDRLERGLPVFVPGKGDNPWTLTATSDFAKGLSGLVGNSAAIGETFHITSDEHPSWKEIYLTANIRGDKCEPSVFDNSKIRSCVPAFECTKPLEKGLRESISWMRSHPEDKVIKDAAHETFDKVVSAWRSNQTS